MKRKYSYKNLFVFGGLVVVFGVILFIYKVSISELMYKLGYYEEKITILNTADIHGRMLMEKNTWGQYTSEDIDLIMGLPLQKGLIDQEKNKNPNSLVFDSGDFFHGTNESAIGDGEGMLELANIVKFDGMAIGNNDFNFGVDQYFKLTSSDKLPILSSNLMNKENKNVFTPNKVYTVANKKIGVFSLLPDSLNTNKVFLESDLYIESPEKMAEEQLKLLKKQNVDAVILLSHLGDNVDVELAKKVKGIDLIISSRRHNLYTKGVQVENTMIAESGAWTTHLGAADFYFKEGKLKKIDWRVLSTDNERLQDQSMKKIAQKYEKEALKQTKVKLGTIEEDLNGARTEIRTSETNFGDLVADAAREYGKSDIALINSGVIRESLKKGEVNEYQLSKALPYSNSLVVLNVKGENIVKALERGMRKYPDGLNGAFLQVSGMKITIDSSKEVGKKVQKVLIDGAKLENDQLYRVTTTDYLYFGGDDYDEFETSELVDSGPLIKDAVKEYINAEKIITLKDNKQRIIIH